MLAASRDLSPGLFTPVPIPAGERPRLFVIVDTEEEFDWSAPFSRDNVSVTAIDEVWRLQDVLARHGVVPTYVIDYPVATTPLSARRLGALARSGACQVGAHLHPWVNPPYVEVVDTYHSYACNLGMDVELEKIRLLRDAIVEHVGVTPRVYKAGRYGFGPTSAHVLEMTGFDVDASINPHMDYQGDGGPTFRAFTPAPAFFGSDRRLLEVPCTTAFVGLARRFGGRLHRVATALEAIKAVGVLSRTGALNKIMLSPEGSTLAEMKALTRTLVGDGLRTFSLTFHSPSLKPGCTRYVRSEAERDAFLNTIDQYCQFFLREIGGTASTPADWHDQLTRGYAT